MSAQTEAQPAAPVQGEQGDDDNNQRQSPVEVDSDLTGDEDSSYGDDISTYTASLTSSVRNYQYENGRRYHAYREGAYLFPNDDEETDRIDIHNHMVGLMLDGKLHLAPIGKSPQRILDLGTGTGIWAINMGDEYPSAEVIGNDLSPIQPSVVPPNVRFLVDDIEDEWPYNDAGFDYIHARHLAAAILNWPQLIRRAYPLNVEDGWIDFTTRHTNPGGWAEFQDWDATLRCDDSSLKSEHALAKWHDVQLEAFNKNNRTPTPGPNLQRWMIDAGFTNVHQKVLKLPLGLWPKDKKLKEIGAWNLLQIQQGMEAFSLAPLTRVMNWKVEEVQLLLAKVCTDLKDSRIHSYYNFHVAYGQKPEEKQGEAKPVS
ncbi:MAG: hypothetical protein M1816_005902 [Peltula sp. TS41687]|nr:MAG: hypothetical protein M1816_005902 [Peltula sp. TS41687]